MADATAAVVTVPGGQAEDAASGSSPIRARPRWATTCPRRSAPGMPCRRAGSGSSAWRATAASCRTCRSCRRSSGQRIPAKIFLYNNSGYHSIRQSQQAHFNGFSVGCGPDSGVTFPDFGRIAAAFGFDYVRDQRPCRHGRGDPPDAGEPGPAICEVVHRQGAEVRAQAVVAGARGRHHGHRPARGHRPIPVRARSCEANMLIPLMN